MTDSNAPTTLSERLGVTPSTLTAIGLTRQPANTKVAASVADRYRNDPDLAEILSGQGATPPTPVARHTARVTHLTNTGQAIPQGRVNVTDTAGTDLTTIIERAGTVAATLAVISKPQTLPPTGTTQTPPPTGTTRRRVIIGNGIPNTAAAHEIEGSGPELVTVALLNTTRGTYEHVARWLKKEPYDKRPDITLTADMPATRASIVDPATGKPTATPEQIRDTKLRALEEVTSIAEVLSPAASDGFVRILIPAQRGNLWHTHKNNEPVDKLDHEPVTQADTRRAKLSANLAPPDTGQTLRAWHESYIQNLSNLIDNLKTKAGDLTRADKADIDWAIASIDISEQEIALIDNPEPEPPEIRYIPNSYAGALPIIDPKTGAIKNLDPDDQLQQQELKKAKAHYEAQELIAANPNVLHNS